MSAHCQLPLRHMTTPQWAPRVLEAPLLLLNDHAHLERKAASNALDLLNRWPEPTPPDHWIEAMAVIAREECEHLTIVTRLLSHRGGHLRHHHHNSYASALRKLIRYGRGADELVDRLLVSALIEARSCERFMCLAQNDSEEDLNQLYRSLQASEAGHYQVFHGLAQRLQSPDMVKRRWSNLLNCEAEIILAQPCYPGMHSGER